MFTLEAKKTLVGLSVVTALVVTGCSSSNEAAAAENTSMPAKTEKNVDGAVKYSTVNGYYTSYAVNPNAENAKGFQYGKAPSKAEIAEWDLDVMPDGTGLPEGSGSVELGDELYEAQCAMCHGEMGTGGKGYPTLVGGSVAGLKNQLINPGDQAPIRTIGSYWPYASTLFWYIKSAMPFPHPKSLTDDEVYAITAYLLSVNEIQIDGEEMDDEYVLDREKFLKIKMPNVDGFYPNVENGSEEMNKFLNNPANYGTILTKDKCMTDCRKKTATWNKSKKEDKVVAISQELTGIEPPLSQVRDLPPKKEGGASHPGQATYEASCSSCHANAAIGAPVVGDKDAWATVMAKGIDKVYHNALNGTESGMMPPKGGNMDLSDSEVKAAVDYMVSQSK
jgi:cytochrome c